MKPILTTIFLFTTLLLSTPALAQDSFGEKPVVTDGTIDVRQGFVPCSGTQCSPCDLVVLFNTLLKWFMTIAFLIFAILAMKAGISLVTSGGNPSALSAAKKSFTNAFIGLIIILAAWLIVDTLLRGVLKGGNLDSVYKGYGPWSAVQCVNQADVRSVEGYFDTDPVSWKDGELMRPKAQAAPYTGGNLSQCAAGNAACNPATLEASGMTKQQASVMSCIAMTESGGNPSLPAFYKTHPKSSACGTFQIIKSTWESKATGSCASFSSCTNATCNAQVAAKLVQSSGYKPWTCTNCNSKAQKCINQYGV